MSGCSIGHMRVHTKCLLLVHNISVHVIASRMRRATELECGPRAPARPLVSIPSPSCAVRLTSGDARRGPIHSVYTLTRKSDSERLRF